MSAPLGLTDALSGLALEPPPKPQLANDGSQASHHLGASRTDGRPPAFPSEQSDASAEAAARGERASPSGSGPASARGEPSSAFDYSAFATARRTTRDQHAKTSEPEDDPNLHALIELGVRRKPAAGVSRRAFLRSITHLHLDGQRLSHVEGIQVRGVRPHATRLSRPAAAGASRAEPSTQPRVCARVLTPSRRPPLRPPQALPVLEVAFISGNALTSLEPFSHVRSLRQLHAEDNALASLDDWLAPGSLERLRLSRNRLTHVGGLDRAVRLRELHVAQQRLAEGEPFELPPGSLDGCAQALESLRCAGNGVGAESVHALLVCSALREIDISGCDLGVDDAPLLGALLNGCERLAKLNIAPCPLAAAPRGALAHTTAQMPCAPKDTRSFILLAGPPCLAEVDGRAVGVNERPFVVGKLLSARARARGGSAPVARADAPAHARRASAAPGRAASAQVQGMRGGQHGRRASAPALGGAAPSIPPAAGAILAAGVRPACVTISGQGCFNADAPSAPAVYGGAAVKLHGAAAAASSAPQGSGPHDGPFTPRTHAAPFGPPLGRQ